MNADIEADGAALIELLNNPQLRKGEGQV